MQLFKDALLKNIAILLMGILIFYIDDREFLNLYYTKWLILIIALFKTGYFFVQAILKIYNISGKEVSYHHFLLFMGINILIIIISFTVDFICLHWIDPSSFSGLSPHLSFPDTCFELFYLSILGFNNLGFYDITPVGKPAKFLVIIEIFSYISTIIFILSDFASLKDSLIEIKNKKKNNSKSDL